MSLKYGSDLPQKLGGGDLQHKYGGEVPQKFGGGDLQLKFGDVDLPQKYGTTRFAQTEGSMIRIQHKKPDKEKFSTAMQDFKNKN